MGHSMGAHIAGAAGRKFFEMSNKSKKLSRITALDAATFPFAPGLFHHIRDGDAEFVDIIHTDAWIYGSVFGIGTVDFWPNGGKMQPGCPVRRYDQSDEGILCNRICDNVAMDSFFSDLQSHQRSWRYWAESVSPIYRSSFCAVKCDSWSSFQRNDFKPNATITVMGIECNLKLVDVLFIDFPILIYIENFQIKR